MVNQISNSRNTNIELLRYVLMFMICIWHTLVHGYDYKNMSDAIVPDSEEVFFMGLCVPAVDTFILISGYFGIKYSVDKLLRLVIQALIVSNLITLVRFFLCNGSMDFYLQVFPISSECWWFLSVYIVIMLLSPIINSGIDMISSKTFVQILFPLFFIYSIVQYRLDMNRGGNLITMFLLYLLGRYLRKIDFQMSKVKSLFLFCCSFMCLITLMFYFFYIGNFKVIWRLLYYNNPLVILMAISIFFFTISFRKQIFPRITAFLGCHSLTIYMFTELIGVALYKYWGNLLGQNLTSFFISILLITLLIETIDVPIQYINRYFRAHIFRLLIVVSAFLKK